MNKFGGLWTKHKIDIIEKYAQAYLKVMSTRTYWPIMYFDGFAGTGEINLDKNYELVEGVAKKILSIEKPRTFDMYYFVELDIEKAKKIKKMVTEFFPNKKKIHISVADCNDKLLGLAKFLKSNDGYKYKVLAFIDPYGMELNWNSLESLKSLAIDLWLLIPTGIGANRLLKRNGNISDAWIERLEKFLGISKEKIMNFFYRTYRENTLFGEVNVIQKKRDTIEKIHQLYTNRLKEIFKFVSEPFVMRNSKNSIMFHFLMATNNKTALKIANDIIKPNYKL